MTTAENVSDAKSEPSHRAASGNNLRAAVLGANDGLVSNFCLLMGVAGAGTSHHTVLLTGLAGLVAGACSMALGEWLSVSNARELAKAQIAKEREEIARAPEVEQRELARIYQAKGLPAAEARQVASEIMHNPAAALDTLAREELGIDPAELGGNPWTAAGVSFGLFSTGAIVPVLPLVLLNGHAAIIASILASAAALGGIGALTARFNGRSVWFSALRQVLFGVAAAGLTYSAGIALGVTLS
jgi:vacuolar iron transporter family protein